MKAWERGLAYSSGIRSDPETGFLWYYADRSPDLTTLVNTVNSMAKAVDGLQDPTLVDYALRGTLSFSRAMQPPSERGRLLALDIRDGIPPEKVRRFTEAILKLRTDPQLLSELRHAAFNSMCGVLLTVECLPKHQQGRSIFFFIGSEPTLGDLEKHLAISDFRRLYPSDYWME
jgi:hypothetical protein